MEPEVSQASSMEHEVCQAFHMEPKVWQAFQMEYEVCQAFQMEPEVYLPVETEHGICQVAKEDTIAELPELVDEEKEDTYFLYSRFILQPFPFCFLINRYTVFCTTMYLVVQLNV